MARVVAAGSVPNTVIGRVVLCNDKADTSLPRSAEGAVEGTRHDRQSLFMESIVEDFESSDAVLVAQARQGNPDAFSKLFNRHYPKVFRYAVNMGATADDAEDIVQTAFIRTHRALAKIRDGQALLSYLYQAAMNGVRDAKRRASRKPWISFSKVFGNRGETLEIKAALKIDETRTEMSDALAASIQSLPDDFREVFVLHHLQELDLNQIAEIQKVSIGTVKSRLGRAREKVRAAMKPWLDGDETK